MERAMGIEPTSEAWEDRKSTRLNSSHGYISYAVFCLKKIHRSGWRTIAGLRALDRLSARLSSSGPRALAPVSLPVPARPRTHARLRRPAVLRRSTDA